MNNKELEKLLDKYTRPENISSLYKQDEVKNLRQTNTGENYHDIIAEYLLARENFFEKNKYINQISRHSKGKIYNVKREPLEEKKKYFIHKEKRYEEWYAKFLFDSSFEPIGKIIHYQTPINSTNSDGAGDVDLLAYDENNNRFSLIELKMIYNQEPILRAILEICTYHAQLADDELKKDFGYPDAHIQKIVLIFKDSPQYKQYKESEHIRKLAKKLDVTVLAFDTIITVVPCPSPNYFFKENV